MDLNLIIVWKLLLASVLGGLIGLERELHQKPAGLRTNLFMCVGATLYTILSGQLAEQFGGDHTRIAAQIIPGIGFIGAGAILRDRGGVVGLTTAATIFVVASIGMAVGGGMYWTATYTALMCLVALSILGWIEERALKRRVMVFRITVTDPEPALKTAHAAIAELNLQMQHFQMLRVGAEFLLEFEVEVSHAQEQELLGKLGTLGGRCEVVRREAVAE